MITFFINIQEVEQLKADFGIPLSIIDKNIVRNTDGGPVASYQLNN
jgi:hypothetical protein